MQSKKDLAIDSSLKIDVGLMRYDQRGSGGDSRKIINALSKDKDNTIRLKRSMVYIPEVKVRWCEIKNMLCMFINIQF